MPLHSRCLNLMLGAAVSVALASPAFAETLPWLSGGQQPAPAQPAQAAPARSGSPSGTHSAHHTGTSKSSTHHSASAEPELPPEEQRKADDRHLDDLAVVYSHIHASDKDAVAKLKKLQTQVSASLSKLKKRHYDAADIIKDTQFLASRVSAQIKKIETAEKATPGTENPAARTEPSAPAKEEAPSAGHAAEAPAAAESKPAEEKPAPEKQ